MQNGAIAFICSLAVPWRVKHRVTTWPRHSTPRYISKRKKFVHTKTCTLMFIAELFTGAQKVAPNPNIHKVINANENVVCPYQKIIWP